jgi:hypothetical protein
MSLTDEKYRLSTTGHARMSMPVTPRQTIDKKMMTGRVVLGQ